MMSGNNRNNRRQQMEGLQPAQNNQRNQNSNAFKRSPQSQPQHMQPPMKMARSIDVLAAHGFTYDPLAFESLGEFQLTAFREITKEHKGNQHWTPEIVRRLASPELFADSSHAGLVLGRYFELLAELIKLGLSIPRLIGDISSELDCIPDTILDHDGDEEPTHAAPVKARIREALDKWDIFRHEHTHGLLYRE